MDTLSAYLSSGHIAKSLEAERLAMVQRTWRESFGHPAHRDMLQAHQVRADEFYGRSVSPLRPATPAQLADLVSAVTAYRPPKQYKPRKKTPTVIPADRLLQIAVQAAARKKAS